MKFFVRRRGSISLFLAIIMLPCLTFTGIMVDMANMTLSKPVVESAGALAANAVLANYDTVLEEVYGLFAMSQKADNPEEALMENLKQYFTDSIKANGLLSDEDSMDLSSKLLGSLKDALYQNGSDDINQNFLKISLADLEGTYLEDSSLANSEILKNQIIEYMKYRGPVAVTMSLVDSLGAFKKMNKQSPVAESKMRVDEKLGDLAKSCKKFYDALKEYDGKVKEYEQTEAEYEQINFEEQMKELHKDIVKYLMFEVKDIDHLIFIDSDTSSVKSSYEAASDARQEFDYIISANSELISHMIQETGSMGKYLNPEAPNMYKAKLCFDEYDKEFYPDVVSPLINLRNGIQDAIKDLSDDIDRLKKDEHGAEYDEAGHETSPAVDHSSEISDLEDKISEWNNLMGEVQSKIQGYNTDVSRPMQGRQTTYIQTVSDAKGRAAERIRNMFPCLFNMYDKAQEVGRKGYHGFFSAAADSGDYAQGRGENVKKMLQKVTDANEEFSKKIITYGEQDDFRVTMESNQKKTAELFKPEDVDEILEQLEAGRRYLTNEEEPLGVIPTLKEYVFYGKHIVAGPDTTGSGEVRSGRFDPERGEGKVLDYMVELAENMLGAEIGVEHGDSGITADYVDALYANHVNLPRESVLHRGDDSPYPSSRYYIKMISEAGVKVKDRAETINVPAFYVYLATTYGGVEDTEEKAKYKSIKEEANKSNEQARKEGADKSPDIAYNRDVFKNVPTDIISTGVADMGKFDNIDDKDGGEIDQFAEMSKSNGKFLDILNGTLENVRDNTFLLAFVSENFSNFGDTMKVNGKTKGEGKKTMTNVPINQENNKIYGCEMEYITYGNKGSGGKGWWIFKTGSTGPETNISVVKRDIYGVRLAFNTIYALTDGEIDSWTRPPAIAIQAASQGVIPYQLVQVVAKMALALTESAIDLQLIMKGEKVAVVKTRATWKCQVNNPSELAENISNALSAQVNAKIDGAITSLQKVVDNGVDWSTDEINGLQKSMDENLQSIFDGALRDESSTLANIATNELEQAYFKIYTKGDEYVESELLSQVERSMDEYIATQSNENREFLNRTKTKVLGTIVERGKGYIQKASEYMKKGMKEGLSDAGLDMSAYSDMMQAVTEAQTSYLTDMTRDIADQASSIVEEAGGKIKGCIEFQGNQLKKGVSEEVSKRITKAMDKYFPKNIQEVNLGKEGVAEKSDSVSNTIKFGYEEYLSLFMFLRLCAGQQDAIVRRIGDVIQINLASGITLKNGKQYDAQEDYQLSKAYTYVSLKAKVEVKPLLLSEKLFRGNIGEHFKYFSYEYKNIAGY